MSFFFTSHPALVLFPHMTYVKGFLFGGVDTHQFRATQLFAKPGGILFVLDRLDLRPKAAFVQLFEVKSGFSENNSGEFSPFLFPRSVVE